MYAPRRRNSARRQGVAAAELAICLPIVIAICVATIDICSAMFLRESLTVAAYEGARVGAPKGGTDALVRTRVLDLLDERNIVYDAGDVVSISAPGFGGADTMEHVTVTVRAPAAGNLVSATQFFNNKQLQAQVTMRKEYSNAGQ